MAVNFKERSTYSQKSILQGTEKIVVSGTEYVTPDQINPFTSETEASVEPIPDFPTGGIQDVKVNGVSLEIVDNGVDIPVPTEEDIEDMGFQKDGYTKPSSGIPTTDLESSAQTAIGKVSTIESDVNTIKGKIPDASSSSNQLADKAFVNSSVQTATANFRGSWDNYAAVPSDANSYPSDAAGVKTPFTNDYMVVEADETHSGQTWRYKYVGIWGTDGKSGWQAEYKVNRAPLTQAQLNALNSGVTTSVVSQVDSNTAAIAGKQAALTTLTGYSASARQVLINDRGTLKWMTYTAILTGSAAPLSSQGNDGDLYLQR